MAGKKAEIRGLKELGAALAELKADVALRAARRATAAGVGVIVDKARQLAPVAPEPYEVQGLTVDPGNIGRNIVSKRVPKNEARYASQHLVVVRGGRKHGYASHVGALQEFGTVNQAPQPFMRPALEQSAGAVLHAVADSLTRSVARARKGRAK